MNIQVKSDHPDMPNPCVFHTAVGVCPHCHNNVRIALQIDIDATGGATRYEADYWRDKAQNTLALINSLLQEVEVKTGYNPSKEILVRGLVEIRERFMND